MARKNKCKSGETGRPSGKAAAKAASSRAISKSSTLEDVAVAQGRPSRKLQRRDTDEAVDRAISTHFKGIPRSQLEGKEVEGKSLRARIGADIRATRGLSKAKRLGTRYWRHLRSLYLDAPDLQALPVDKDLPTSPHLRRAMERLVVAATAQRSSEPALSYLKTCEQLNRRELMGICGMLLKPHLLTKGHSCELTIGVCTCLVRLKMVDANQDVLNVMEDLIDESVTTLWLAAKKGKVAPETWIEVYRISRAVCLAYKAVGILPMRALAVRKTKSIR